MSNPIKQYVYNIQIAWLACQIPLEISCNRTPDLNIYPIHIGNCGDTVVSSKLPFPRTPTSLYSFGFAAPLEPVEASGSLSLTTP